MNGSTTSRIGLPQARLEIEGFMARFQFGQIVLAYVSDGTGRTKERPCVIISRDESIETGDDLLVVAITTSIDDPSPSYHVPLPWDPKGHAPTGLDKPNVAKVNWIREVPQSKVIRSLGYVPDDELEEIIRQFEFLESHPELDV
jgi:mRNA-degrading endonuclease toxin of MazEF toxin-antitoxin module